MKSGINFGTPLGKTKLNNDFKVYSVHVKSLLERLQDLRKKIKLEKLLRWYNRNGQPFRKVDFPFLFHKE